MLSALTFLLFSTLALAQTWTQDPLTDKPQLKINKFFSIKLPVNVNNLKSRFWFSGGITLNKNSLQLGEGTASSKSLMGTTKKIHHDDRFEMEMSFKIEKKILNSTETGSLSSDDVSFIAIQFSKDLYNFTYKPTDNDTLVLDGLVFFILNDTVSGKGYIVYRYFNLATSIQRKYVMSLFPGPSGGLEADDRVCQVADLEEIDTIKIVVDYTKEFKLMMTYSNVGNKTMLRCLQIPNIMRYLNKDSAFFSIKTSSGANTALRVGLYKLELKEKQHALDIKKELQISHALVEEIFDKVSTFTEKFSKDKKSLGEIMTTFETLEHYANFLKIFSKDLNDGTRLMQENMMEYVNRNNYLTMNDFPQLKKIKDKIDYVEGKQSTIYARFKKIADMVKKKRVFRKLNKRFKRVEKMMDSLLTTINSDDFEELNTKSNRLLNFIKKVNFDKLLRKARKIVKREERKSYISAGNYGIVSILAICALIFVISCGILKKINAAEKEHIL